MLEAFFAVIPIFLIIGLGVLLRARDVLPEGSGPMLGVYVLKLALPLLILHILAARARKIWPTAASGSGSSDRN